MAKDDKMMANHAQHMKHKGFMMIVIGILVILNSMNAWFNWAEFVGGILVLVGIKLLIVCNKK